MTIRPLDPVADRALVEGLYREAADYVALERDEAPSPALADEFFTDAPPGVDPATSLRLGLFDGGRLAGIAECGFGYPAEGDAYLGLMLLATNARGAGRGAQLLRAVEDQARGRGAPVLFLAVLEANEAGRRFWLREGFVPVRTGLSTTIGNKTQAVQRMGKALIPGATLQRDR